MLKDAIQDEDYSSVLTGLDLLDIPPSVDKCKAEIRKKGAKLELSRKNNASRKARMTYQPEQWDYHKFDPDDSFEQEGLRMIAAAIAAKNDQRKKDPWNLPTVLWKTFTREQQKMWSDFREATRVKGT